MKMPIYDRNTREKLVQCHGAEVAQAIIERRDAATNADIAAWRNIGGLAAGEGAPLDLDGQVMFLAARGKEPSQIASVLRLNFGEVLRIMAAHA